MEQKKRTFRYLLVVLTRPVKFRLFCTYQWEFPNILYSVLLQHNCCSQGVVGLYPEKTCGLFSPRYLFSFSLKFSFTGPALFSSVLINDMPQLHNEQAAKPAQSQFWASVTQSFAAVVGNKMANLLFVTALIPPVSHSRFPTLVSRSWDSISHPGWMAASGWALMQCWPLRERATNSWTSALETF